MFDLYYRIEIVYKYGIRIAVDNSFVWIDYFLGTFLLEFGKFEAGPLTDEDGEDDEEGGIDAKLGVDWPGMFELLPSLCCC